MVCVVEPKKQNALNTTAIHNAETAIVKYADKPAS